MKARGEVCGAQQAALRASQAPWPGATVTCLMSCSLQASALSALGPQCHEVWESPSGPLSAQLCFALGDQTLLAL